ncbi:EAL domain-containing protein [Actimicrobium sp. CCC2.4]|uniref:EAL domain-containing protein n=1 Tax=Actimicrobium sp. CCC2.4 TaxID=3048606 RepID=UPI002AC8B434|nr:EAL domain-containing protein [Actimicrobium sp. CCC2.4]MEB0135078.1 EAL domain-containing protein [Actimicrobium sp. CCC2.4]WPX31875.1 EAL domain-containing protein [Actimicrobium sp. CCC2.4]
MTLLRQLTAVIIALFLLLFAGTVAISVSDARTYLDNQLKTISQDTATSLGLSLSQDFAERDMILVDSKVSLIFDSGYYQEVTVAGLDGKPLVQRLAPARIPDVPAWFVRALPIETPRGQALIMAGWQQAGTITVAANPASAYATLWTSSVKSFWWFFAVLVITSLLAMLALRLILRPLHLVEAQARAICDREYPVQDKLPWTLELRSVVVAMNRMTRKIKAMFDDQADAMERLRTDSYRHALTGLANRRYFDLQLQQLLASDEEFHTGALLLFELKEFKALNERRGYTAGDELLRGAVHVIDEVVQTDAGPDCFVAHLAGATFALVLSNVSEHEAIALGERLAAALPQLHQRGLADSDDVGHIGLAMYRHQSVSEFLSEADTALRAAQTKGPNTIHVHVSRGAAVVALTATRWSEFLRDVIERKNIVLHLQPVLRNSGERTVLHYETLLRVTGEDGQLIPAVVFVPMAKRLGLIRQIDRLVVAEVLTRLQQRRYGESIVAVNLFPATLQDPGFITWLDAALRADPVAAKRIAFEVPEYGALDHIEALRTLVNLVHRHGGQFGMDHFGRGFASFGYLATLKLDYLKIDGSFIRAIDTQRDNQFLVEAICKIAHGLDVQVIAEAVETDAERAMLATLKVDGVQGYGIGMPAGM